MSATDVHHQRLLLAAFRFCTVADDAKSIFAASPIVCIDFSPPPAPSWLRRLPTNSPVMTNVDLGLARPQRQQQQTLQRPAQAVRPDVRRECLDLM
ncbi:MAG TPA: hypothetical protein VKD71_16285 [Gemmataceae bacterium]|nr:hypothetical protein [Gemmataceae bacterium]